MGGVVGLVSVPWLGVGDCGVGLSSGERYVIQ